MSEELDPDDELEAPLLDDLVCFALHAASRASIAVYRPALSEFDLTYLQYLVMLLLWERDSRSLGEIGSRLLLDSGTLTPLLKRLASKGYVTRRRDPDDERIVRIDLTGPGLEIRPRVIRAVRALTCQLSEAPLDLEMLRESAVVIREHLRSHLDSGAKSAVNDDAKGKNVKNTS